MWKRKATWSTIANESDRDVVVSLLRSAGHGPVLDRNVDLVLSSKVKIDMHGNVVELTLGTKDRSSFRYQQQQQQQRRNRRRLRNNGNNATNNNDENNDALVSFWDLSESVGKLDKLHKLVLHRCRSISSALNDLPNLTCLELHFCHGNHMARRQEQLLQCSVPGGFGVTTNTRGESISDNNEGNCYCSGVCRLPHLTTLEINDGVWNAESVQWVKWMISTKRSSTTFHSGTSTEIARNNGNATKAMNTAGTMEASEEYCGTSQLQVVRFSCLPNDLLDSILQFLSPWKTAAGFRDKGSVDSNGDDDGVGNDRERKPVSIGGTITTTTSSCLKRLSWTHSGMTDRGLDRLLRGVVLPFHPHLTSLDVSGNHIRSLQWLLEPYDENERDREFPLGVSNDDLRPINQGEIHTRQSKSSISSNDRENHSRTASRYHSLRTLNLQHNPILKQKTAEEHAFEALLLHYFPVLCSLTPHWEQWDAPIERLLRINRGGRVFVEGTPMPRPAGRDRSTRRNNDAQTEAFQTNLPLAMWPLVLQRAYETSEGGFLPIRKDATAVYYLVRNGPALSELFAAAK